LIFPEVYLEDSGRRERIDGIQNEMRRCLDGGVFAPPQKTLVYVERDTPFHTSRRGLLVALDLEAYDWKTDGGSVPLMIRPTEGTVAARLPSRMEVRRGAPLESPHILVLLDDEENTLLPALGERAKKAAGQSGALYDTELMLDSGRVRGWKLDSVEDWEFLAAGLEKLARKAAEKYGAAGGAAAALGEHSQSQDSAAQSGNPAPFLYAMGDGNHSLAAAKGVWEEYKAARQHDPDIMDHPARWALVELENLYDPALSFEPIHRLVFGAGLDLVQETLARLPGCGFRKVENAAELTALVGDENCRALRLGLVSDGNCILAEADPVPLAIDALQPLLDALVAGQNGKASLEYIHGVGEVFRLSENNAVGILLPPFRKQGLFRTIAKRGPLPRKSFSMGESCEKRFYLECRKLFG
jgi:hypothetical protein